jgi:hypothetical protein
MPVPQATSPHSGDKKSWKLKIPSTPRRHHQGAHTGAGTRHSLVPPPVAPRQAAAVSRLLQSPT